MFVAWSVSVMKVILCGFSEIRYDIFAFPNFYLLEHQVLKIRRLCSIGNYSVTYFLYLGTLIRVAFVPSLISVPFTFSFNGKF